MECHLMTIGVPEDTLIGVAASFVIENGKDIVSTATRDDGRQLLMTDDSISMVKNEFSNTFLNHFQQQPKPSNNLMPVEQTQFNLVTGNTSQDVETIDVCIIDGSVSTIQYLTDENDKNDLVSESITI